MTGEGLRDWKGRERLMRPWPLNGPSILRVSIHGIADIKPSFVFMYVFQSVPFLFVFMHVYVYTYRQNSKRKYLLMSQLEFF